MAKSINATKAVPSPETVTAPIALRPVLGDYCPFEALWSEQATSPVFNSEGAARWFFRNNRARLVEAKATVIHTGRVLVNPERFAAVALMIAMENAEKRIDGGGHE